VRFPSSLTALSSPCDWTGARASCRSVVVYFSLMDGVRCLDVAARGKRDRGSQATIADHVRQTYSIKSTTTIHGKEIALHASACSSPIRHAVVIVALGVTATAYRSLSSERQHGIVVVDHSRHYQYHYLTWKFRSPSTRCRDALCTYNIRPVSAWPKLPNLHR
jgi:hypothetical protein